MSNSNESTLNPAEGSTEPTVISPEEIVRQLRTLREQMPTLTPPAVSAQRLGRLAHVDADFVQATVNATGASENVANALGRSDEEQRQEIELAARWTAVTDEARALLQASLAAGTIRRQRIGLTALQTYQICQQLARDDKHSGLSTHIREMRRLNKFGRVRRATAAPQPAPEAAAKPQ
jgi:hypothetical protein